MSWIATYLLIGVGFDIIYSFIANITESKNKLSNYERVISLVIWPISLSIFMYHFIKGLKR
jgi:putative Mn2+ efflux pump MntP